LNLVVRGGPAETPWSFVISTDNTTNGRMSVRMRFGSVFLVPQGVAWTARRLDSGVLLRY
jgi:hypothetical protein